MSLSEEEIDLLCTALIHALETASKREAPTYE